ncbi:MAG: hypothetical protein ACRD15_13005 [Vicinamibacterales bacterium]
MEIVAMKKQRVLVWVAGALVLAMAATGSDVAAQHKAPNQQPATAEVPKTQAGDLKLGSVRLPRAVTADGKPLPAGTYQVRLTAQESKPDAVGQSGELERWVEFVRGGKVAGREVVSIVPQAEIKMVGKDSPPPSGSSKVQVLRGNDYLRVWINRGGNHYLMHFPIEGAGSPATK